MITGIYLLKKEFAPLIGIPNNQIDRRKEELYEWLKNFFDYEILDGCPIRINIKEQIGEYQPMPRKYNNKMREEKIIEAKEDYEKFTIAALGNEFKPNSKAKIARDAIYDFGREKYHHTNSKAVTERFIKEPFNKYGVTNEKYVWVDYNTYKPLTTEALDRWKEILKEEHLSDDVIKEIGYKSLRKEDITEERNYYQTAMDRFAEEFGIIPIRVREWKAESPV